MPPSKLSKVHKLGECQIPKPLCPALFLKRNIASKLIPLIFESPENFVD